MELRRYLRVGTILFLATAAQALTTVFGVSILLAPKTAGAVASVPYLVNFQGRLTDNSGNALSDGSYNVKFRLMSAATSGTNLWEGDRVMGATDHRISVVNGLFNIQFGDTTLGDPALSPGLFNTQTNPNLYLEVELPTPATASCATNGCAVFTEGAMTPRQPLASAPYAFNSDTLDGLDSASFGQLSAIQSWTDTNTFSKSGGAAIVLSGTAASTGSILQIGSALSGGNASGTLFGANTTSTGDLINLQVSSALKLKIDNTGTLTTAGNLGFTAGANHTLSVAQAAAATAGNSLTVTAGQSGTGAVNGGNLVLQAGATGGTGTSGSVIIKANGVDTTTAVQIQNAAAAPAFTVDTVANKIIVGDATGVDAATSLLVIDTATADPATGYNGAMYYNSTSATFRCYQGGAWTSCITPGITASANSQANFISGKTTFTANTAGQALTLMVSSAATTFTNNTGLTTFTAPAAGWFRSCLLSNSTAVTASTIALRWRVNGVSVGSAACSMSTTTNRQATTTLDNGVVAFNAGDAIGVALDTGVGFTPTASTYTAYWNVEYKAASGNGLTLQFVYDSSSTPAGITLANAKDLVVTAADTATDPNFLVNLQCVTTCSTNGRFAVQNAGSDAFAVAPNGGGITLGQSTSVSAGKNLTLASGAGTFNQTFTNNTASSAQSLNLTNSNTGAGVAIQGATYTPANAATPSSGLNALNVLSFAAGTLTGTNTTNGINFTSATGYTNFIQSPSFDLNSSGDLTTAFTALNGTSTANGAGTASTTLILTSATNFDIGNYVQVNSANCGGTGVNPCYAKVTNKVTNTLTITPALTWANGSTVNEYHIPEVGGTDTAQTLANRYGRGYFIAGVATGNGTTYYNEDSVESSLATFNLLNANVTTLNIGAAASAVTIGGAGTTLSVPGNLSTTGSGTITAAGGINVPTGQTYKINGVQIDSSALSNDLNITKQGNTFNGVSQLVQTNGSGALPVISGANLTTLTAANLTGALPAISGASLTGLNASNIATGSGAVSITSGGATSLSLTSGSGTINLGSNTLQHSTTPLSIDVATAGTSTLNILNSTAAQVANLDVDGSLNIGSGQTYGVGGTAGASATCSGGQMLQNPTLTGGIITAGTCATPSGTGANTNLNNLATTSINQTLIANATNALDLGTSAITWRTGYFGTSLQSPSYTGTGAVTVSSGGIGALTLDSGSGALIIAASDTTLQRTATGTYTIDLNDAGATTLAVNNSGTGVASLTVEGGVSIGTGQTYKINNVQIDSSALSNDSSITKQGNTFNGVSQLVQTNGSGQLPALSGTNLTALNAANLTGTIAAISGTNVTNLNPTNLATGSGAVTLQSGGAGALTLTSASGTISLGSATLQRSAAALTVDVANAAASTLSLLNSNGANVVNVSVDGALAIGSGQAYSVGASAGSSLTCSGGQMIQNPTLTGGIITAGACATPSGTGANTNLSNVAATSVSASLISNANNTLAIGSASNVWQNVFTGNLDAGTTTTTLTIGTAGTTTALTIGRVGLAASLPGGLTTSGGTINTGAGSITTTGALSGGAITGTSLGLGSGNITTTGTISGVGSSLTSLNPSSLTTGTGAVTLQSAAAAAITITANAASTWSTTGAGNLTLDSGGGALVLGSSTTSIQKGAAAFAIDLATAATSTLTVKNTNGANVANLAVTGNIDAGTGKLFSIGGTQISSANLSNDANITKLGNTFNGVSQLIQTTAGGAYPALSGAAITNLTAANLTGTIAAISGANLTSLNPTNLATGSGAVSLASGAATGLTLDAANGTIIFGTNTNTLQRAAAAFSLDLATAGTSTFSVKNTNGANVANLDVDGGLNIATGQTYKIAGVQITSAALSNDANITKQGNTFNGTSQLVQTNGSGQLPALNASGLTNLNPSSLATGSGAVTLASTTSALTLTSGSGTIALGSSIIQRAAAGLTLDVSNAGTSTLTVSNTNGANVANLAVDGGVNIGTGQVFSVGATNGVTIAACTTGQYLSSQSATGGLVTGGACATNDLQTTYGNSTSPATIALTDAKNFVINAPDTATDPSIVVNLQCATCSAQGGRFAVQDNGTDVFTVNPAGSISVNPTAGQQFTLTEGAGTTATITSGTTVPTTPLASIDNTGSTGVTTSNINALNVKYKGGAAAVEAAGMRVDFTPGTTSGGTWSGVRIVAGATGTATGVTEYGLKLEGPTAPGTGTEEAIRIATGWDIGLDIQSGGMQLADMSTDPATPASGNLRVYSRLTAGRSMLAQKGSSGVSYVLQPSLAQQNVMLVTPGGTAAATLNATGGQITTSGTLNTSIASTEAGGSMASYTTTATGTPAGFAGANNQFFRGSLANGADGFFYLARINLSDGTLANYTSTTTGTRMFFGLTDQTMATMGASNTPTGNYAGFQFAPSRDAGVMQFTSRDGTTQTLATTGITLALAKTYDLYVYMKPRDSTVYWRLDNLTDGTTAEGSKTTNLPTTTVAMKPMMSISELANSTRLFSFQRMYVESDR